MIIMMLQLSCSTNVGCKYHYPDNLGIISKLSLSGTYYGNERLQEPSTFVTFLVNGLLLWFITHPVVFVYGSFSCCQVRLLVEYFYLRIQISRSWAHICENKVLTPLIHGRVGVYGPTQVKVLLKRSDAYLFGDIIRVLNTSILERLFQPFEFSEYQHFECENILEHLKFNMRNNIL